MRRHGSKLSQIVAVVIGLFVLLVLVVLFLKRKPTVEEKLQDMTSELRNEDEMFNILADGQRNPKDDGTDNQNDKRSFLSKLPRLFVGALILGSLIVALSIRTSEWCCYLCLRFPDWFMAGRFDRPQPGCLHGMLLWVVKWIWLGALYITAVAVEAWKWLRRRIGWLD